MSTVIARLRSIVDMLNQLAGIVIMSAIFYWVFPIYLNVPVAPTTYASRFSAFSLYPDKHSVEYCDWGLSTYERSRYKCKTLHVKFIDDDNFVLEEGVISQPTEFHRVSQKEWVATSHLYGAVNGGTYSASPADEKKK